MIHINKSMKQVYSI